MGLLRLVAQSSVLRVTGGLLQLGLTFLVARTLPTALAGAFFFEFAVVTIAGAVARLGSESSALREVAIAWRTPAGSFTLERELYSRFLLVTGLSLSFGVVYLVLAELGATRVTVVEAAVVAASIVCSALVGLGAEVLKAMERPALALVVQNAVMPAVSILLVLGLAPLYGASLLVTLVSVTVGFAAALAIAVVALVLAVRPRPWAGFPADIPSVLRGHVLRAPVLMGGVVAPVVMQWAGSLILGVLASASAVAVYTVAARLASVVGLLNSAAASVITPRMAVLRDAGDARGFSRLVHIASLVISATSLAPILVLAGGAGLVLSFFGEGYAQGSLVLQCLMLGQLAAAVIGHGGQALVAAGHYRAATVGPVAAVVSYLGLLLLLVPAAGAVGAAVALTSGVVAGHAAAAIGLRMKEGIWPVPVRRRDWTRLREAA